MAQKRRVFIHFRTLVYLKNVFSRLITKAYLNLCHLSTHIYFREYDIRGNVEKDFPDHVVKKLGQSIWNICESVRMEKKLLLVEMLDTQLLI